METRRLGRTGLRLSLLGFGGSPLGGMFGAVDELQTEQAIHLAIDRGINFFDVSPFYGLTLAERRLGDALQGKREKVVVSTKCGRYGDDEFDFSPRRIATGLDESLRRLRTEYVDLLFAHDIEFGDLEQIIHETIPAMRRLQEQGKARFIGISGYPLKALARVARSAPLDAVLSYCHYNLLATDLDEVLTPLAKEKGFGLINASGLGMGLLTAQGPPEWHPAPERLRSAARAAVNHCAARGADISALALGFCLSHPFVSSTLVGMANPRGVESNLRIFEESRKQGEQDWRAAGLLNEVREILRPVQNTSWPSGRPENNG